MAITGTPTTTDHVIVATSTSGRTFTITHTLADGNLRTCAGPGGGCNGTGW